MANKMCSACKQTVNVPGNCKCGYWTPKGEYNDAHTGHPTFRWLVDVKPKSGYPGEKGDKL